MFLKKKFFIALSVILFASLFLLLLSSFSLLLSILLIGLAYLKHRILPIQKELLWYLLICLCGTITEVLLVNIGGAWRYTNGQFFNIPIWMSLFWGVIGTSVIVMYDDFIERPCCSKVYTPIAHDKPCPQCQRYDNRGISVDALIIKDGQILLIRRGAEPDKGKWATPGGYIGWDESAHEAVIREVKEETGLVATKTTFLTASSSPNRHPKQVITLAYLVEVDDSLLANGDDAEEAKWFPLDALPTSLAFDHKETISLAVSRRQT